MELHQMQILDSGTAFIGQGDAVAGGDGGVGGVRIHPADPARTKDAVGTGQNPRFVPDEELRPEAPLPRHQIHELGIIEKVDVGLFHGGGQQLLGDFPAGRVLVMQNPAAGMPALQRHGNVVLGIPVEIDMHFLEKAQDVLGSFVDQNFQTAQIVFIAARDQGIRNMEPEIVVLLVHHRGHASLGQGAVAEHPLLLGQHQHPHLGREVESRIQSGHTAARDQYIIVVHVAPFFLRMIGFSGRSAVRRAGS